MIDKSIQYGKFRFGIVNNKDVLKDTFRMRHEVYVQEFGFEKAGVFPNRLYRPLFQCSSNLSLFNKFQRPSGQ